MKRQKPLSKPNVLSDETIALRRAVETLTYIENHLADHILTFGEPPPSPEQGLHREHLRAQHIEARTDALLAASKLRTP